MTTGQGLPGRGEATLPMRLTKLKISVGWMAALLGYTMMAQGPAASSTQLATDAQKQLRGKAFRDVQVSAAGGVVTLTGQVQVLADKLDAEKRINRMHEAASIENSISVQVPPGLSDTQLFSKLGKALTYDRQGYGTLPFNSITLRVSNGIVLLGGEVVLPVDKDSAVALVTNTPGVRGLIDHLQVAPLSPNDDQIRRAEFQAVYGAPQFNQYRLDPAKPIRIVVINGRVTLTGVVNSSGDKEIAGLRANGVPGVFAVTNDLQVAGSVQEH